jgi:hypothetical protein
VPSDGAASSMDGVSGWGSATGLLILVMMRSGYCGDVRHVDTGDVLMPPSS